MAQQLDVRYVNYYCAGSSALKVTPAIPLETVTLPRKRKAKKLVLRVDPVACAGILLAGVMLVLMTVGFVQLNMVREEAAVMAEYVQTLQQENDELSLAFESGYNLEEVKEVALALGMVPEDQVRHISIPADAPVQEAENSAWHNFWASVVDFFA